METTKNRNPGSAHTFFIPVMGIGFTIDTALKIARYGVSSVLSLVDDTFIQQMCKYHSELNGEPFKEIGRKEEDFRAKRTTAYLNLVDKLVKKQVKELQASPFEPGSEITRYYELLPQSGLKAKYKQMIETEDLIEKEQLQSDLRLAAVPGTIDVNIMTKVDRMNYRKGQMLGPEYSDTRSALRGYANSTLSSSLVLSAGLNPQLYSYIANFEDFFPDTKGQLKKQVVLKVSDYRSAEVQTKFLAKRGVWVSEYRIESGLNCGGHAFAAKGHLMGPILEEFREKKDKMVEQTHDHYMKALPDKYRANIAEPHNVRLTVAGGIGTADEHQFLLKYYNVDKAGWGTPFLLVPEVTNVDDEHLQKLADATDDDVYLSMASPLLVPFWNLRTSASEEARRRFILEGKPGSLCPKGHGAIFDTEFSQIPDCVSARSYVMKKVESLKDKELTEEQREWIREEVLAKSCICHDLSGGATIKLGIDTSATPCICCGPGIVNFSRIASLEEMVGHIYGRLSLLANSDRPHMFIKEMSLNIEFLRKEIEKYKLELTTNGTKYFQEFKENLLSSIDYYRKTAEQFVETKRTKFLDDLKLQKEAIEKLFASFPMENITKATG
ncbi:MAG: hypothetical protein RRA15_09640 [bacterium]|nr:hypothetical protein [bacterium]MDT8366741.1 hypothetical protein [bacterium]